jgi:hypothetical protein
LLQPATQHLSVRFGKYAYFASIMFVPDIDREISTSAQFRRIFVRFYRFSRFFRTCDCSSGDGVTIIIKRLDNIEKFEPTLGQYQQMHPDVWILSKNVPRRLQLDNVTKSLAQYQNKTMHPNVGTLIKHAPQC